jgi:hypothetical protein
MTIDSGMDDVCTTIAAVTQPSCTGQPLMFILVQVIGKPYKIEEMVRKINETIGSTK